MPARLLRRLSVAAALMLAAAPAAGEPVVYAAAGPVLGLDPHINNERLTNAVKLAVYEPLVRRRPDLTLAPALATRWERLDPVTWRFHLRPEVVFHDGSPFTAEDVVFSFDRVRQPDSEMAWTVASVDEMTVDGPLTVTVSTGEQPRPTLLAELAFFAIMDGEWAERHAAVDVVRGAGVHSHANITANGTGPFRAELRTETDETMLRRHADWWGWSDVPGTVDELVVRPYRDAEARRAALIEGAVDVIAPLPADLAAGIADHEGLTLHRTEGLRVLFLGFDQRADGLFADPRARRAVRLAVDRQRLADAAGDGLVPADLLVAPGIAGDGADIADPPAPDPAAARRLLQAADLAGRLAPVLDCPDGRYPNDLALCRSIADRLHAVGIRATVRARPASAHLQAIGRGDACDSDLYLLGWLPGRFDAGEPIAELLTTGAGGDDSRWNCGRYDNPAVAALARRIAVEYDPGERNRLIGRALELADDDVALLPLVREVRLWATGPAIAAAALHPAGGLDFRSLVRVP